MGSVMDVVTRLDPVTTRILAPNPSLMTLDGTNTYLLGAPGSGEVVCVDPGPDAPGHRAAVEAAAAERDAAVIGVLVTHHHVDHAEAAARWARRWGVPLHAGDPALVPGAATMTDGQRLRAGGVTLEALGTPGHASDHFCIRVTDTGAILSGDLVLGRGTSVIAWPDGDVRGYLASLERLARLDAPVLHPGHGPAVDDPARTIADYLAHRREREAQIVAALTSGATTPAEIVARVYAEVDPALHRAAERSVRAHLDKLVADGVVHRRGDPPEERFDA